jgi:hypothetical protein
VSYVACDRRAVANDDLDTMWKKAALPCFMVLSHDLLTSRDASIIGDCCVF